ncbi:Alpha and gamma adaptin binding protein p34 [Ceratocystis lukuohia]|uniref:Alpha and gamma adaptin binding protein p34 n=1 Tax=Ceratocystis lukuohia TaxID=2019550 RepID=A0ABR4MDE0_9PEZI
MTQDVQNPRRILAVSLDTEGHHLSRIITELTGSSPEPVEDSLAGTSHQLPLTTAYYSADVPIWLDLVSSPHEWSETFLSDEAKEVLEVLGALVVVFSSSVSPRDTAGQAVESGTTIAKPTSGDLLREIGRVVKDGLGGWEWDGVALAIGAGEDSTFADDWEDCCAELGLEFVSVRGGDKGQGRNEFGETMGIARVLEALQANNWASGSEDPGQDGADSDEDQFDLDPDNLDFAMGDPSDFEGLRQAIWGEISARESAAAATEKADADGETKEGPTVENPDPFESGPDDVEKIEKLMMKLKATREMGEGLPEAQRKKMAKKAVLEVMKEL